MQGYIKLSRSFFENPFWNEDRMFSKCEAWLDLMYMDVNGVTKIYDNSLSKKWGWKLKEVIKFVEKLGVKVENGILSKRDLKYLSKKTYLYFIELKKENEILYKVGIAVDVNNRIKSFVKSGYSAKVIKSKLFENRYLAICAESEIKSINKNNRANVSLKFDGCTECFTENIFSTDIEKFYK